MSDEDSRILFNSGSGQWGWLSNFSPHPIGPFPTAEHLYQAMKTTVPEEREMIRQASSPKQAKALSYKITKRPDWSEGFKIDVMLEITRRKFSRPALAMLLVQTGDKLLVHYAPWGDTYWGVDKDGKGRNWQGRILMTRRSELLNGLPREERSAGAQAVEEALRAYSPPGP